MAWERTYHNQENRENQQMELLIQRKRRMIQMEQDGLLDDENTNLKPLRNLDNQLEKANKRLVKDFIKEGEGTLKRLKKKGADKETLEPLKELIELYKLTFKDKLGEFNWGTSADVVDQFREMVITDAIEETFYDALFDLKESYPEESRWLDHLTYFDKEIEPIQIKPIVTIPTNIPSAADLEIIPFEETELYGRDVKWNEPLNPIQEQIYNWEESLQEVALAHEEKKGISKSNLEKWTRKIISEGWYLGKEVPLITEVSTFVGVGEYYGRDVEVLYVIAYDKTDARNYIKEIEYDGFWQRVGPLSGKPMGEMHQKDSLNKYNQLNYTYSDELLQELYSVSQNEQLMLAVKDEGAIGDAFTELVKDVQDKLFDVQPLHYGMYTEETRAEVKKYIERQRKIEDVDSDMSIDINSLYNLSLFYSEDYFTSSQITTIRFLYDTKTLFEEYTWYKEFIEKNPKSHKALLDKVIYKVIKFKNWFPDWNEADWHKITDLQTIPGKNGKRDISMNAIDDPKRFPKGQEKEYEIWNYLFNDSMSYHGKHILKFLLALENTKTYGGLVDGKIDSYAKFEKALNEYKRHLDDGGSLKTHIKSTDDGYADSISFKGTYEHYLWKRSHEMMDAGKDNLKDEFSRYGSVIPNNTFVGDDMHQLSEALQPISKLFKEADTLRKRANSGMKRGSGKYSYSYYTSTGKEQISDATSLEKKAVTQFNKLIPTYPILGSIEFEVEKPEKLYVSASNVNSNGWNSSRSKEVKNIVELVYATQDDKEKAVSILYKIYKDRLADIEKLEEMLSEKPERVWQLHNAIEATKAELGFDPDSAYSAMIDKWKEEYEEDKGFWAVVAQIGLGLLTIIFPVIAPITVPIIVTISAVEFSKHLDQYNFEDAASGGSYDPDDALGGPPPSVVWLVIDAFGIILDVIDVGILARTIARSAREAKLLKNGLLSVDDESVKLFKQNLKKNLNKSNLKNPENKDELIDQIANQQKLKRLQKQEEARELLLKNKKRSSLGKIPKHVIKFFNLPDLGRVMEAGAHRLKEIKYGISDLFTYAVTKYAPSYNQAKWFKLQKLLMIAGESDELAQIVGKVAKTISSKSGGSFTFAHFLDYALGGTSVNYQKFFRNIEFQKVTQKQLDEAVELASKSTTPEKAAQVFHDEVVRVGNENVTKVRNEMDSVTTRDAGDKQKMIDEQVGGSLDGAGGSFTKLSSKSSLRSTLFSRLYKALKGAPSIKFNYGTKALQSPRQFLNEVGDEMYDIVFKNGGYAKFDKATGRMLYSDGKNQYFIRYTSGNDVSNVEQLIKTRVTQLRNSLGLNGPQTIKLTQGLDTVTTNPNKVTTFIGKTKETQLLKDQFGDFRNIELGETPGAVNLLNMPDTYWNPSTWFEDYNQSWMQRAIDRGDDIYIASEINYSSLMNISKDGTEYGSYFALELNELVSAGVKPVNVAQSEWDQLIPSIIDAASKKL